MLRVKSIVRLVGILLRTFLIIDFSSKLLGNSPLTNSRKLPSLLKLNTPSPL